MTVSGTTGRGYPYPGDASDADVPGDIKALADFCNLDMNTVIGFINDQDAALDARLDAIEAEEAWRVVGAVGQPAFQNGWAAFTPAPRFYKHHGRVYLDGTASRGAGTSSGVPIFTLPAGYRPIVSSNNMFRIGVGAGLGYGLVVFEVRQNGDVIPQDPATARLDFCGASFRAEV